MKNIIQKKVQEKKQPRRKITFIHNPSIKKFINQHYKPQPKLKQNSSIFSIFNDRNKHKNQFDKENLFLESFSDPNLTKPLEKVSLDVSSSFSDFFSKINQSIKE